MKGKENVEKFLNDTLDARTVSELCRDYKDGKQWTAQEEAKLKARGQAPIVVNRVKPKVEGLLGLYNLRKSDPKAYSRTQSHEEASHVITDALRFVADNTDFDSIRMEVADNFFVEGYAGAIVDVRQKRDEVEIRIEEIPWDRIYFDPHSRKKDFSDARFMGMILWMGEDELLEKFPKANIDELHAGNGAIDGTFEDKPRWSDKENKRVRLALHFEIVKATWKMKIFSGDVDVVKEQDSPFHDDDGEPTNPIVLTSAFVDRLNNRYSEVKGFLDQQDEINHRRSKGLHMLNGRQTHGRKGAISDIPAYKREMKKPDGHIEWEGEEFGKDFGVMPDQRLEKGQFDLYMDAKAELDAVSFNAQLSGERQEGTLSGVAIGKLQQAGTLEVNRQYSLLAAWELRIYRQVWARIKQFWDKEKWIRVTDNQDNLRWVGFNTPITAQEALEEKINDEAEEYHVRKIAAQMYTQMIQNEDPRLQETVEIRNEIPELDVDIMIDQSFDAVNIQEEQFNMLAQFAQGADVDIIELIEMSQLRGKDELIEKIEKRREAQAQAQGGAQQIAAQEAAARTENVQANTAKTMTEAQQKQVETELLIQNPDQSPQAVV